LSGKGSQKTRSIYAPHGNHAKQMFGMSVAVRTYAKPLPKQAKAADEGRGAWAARWNAGVGDFRFDMRLRRKSTENLKSEI
jgi:hypothetical protein